MANKRSSAIGDFADMMGIRRKPKKTEAEEKADLAQKVAIAMDTFRTRVTSYRNSFNPYQRYAPGFDYVNWKPYGTYRYEDPQLVYVSQARALAPYVHDVAVAACEGVKERQWEAMTFEGQIRIQERTSRAASRMGSRTVSKDNIMYD